MKKIVAYLILTTMVFSSLGSIQIFAHSSSGKFYVSDDMESYVTEDLTKYGDNYCQFGGSADNAEVSDEYVYSGKKSIKLSGRKYESAGLKAIDVFGRKLDKSYVGKTFRISFMIYPDKNAGIYKKDIRNVSDDDMDDCIFSSEDYNDSKGTQITVTMAGPNGDNFKYRQGENKLHTTTFIKWNQWNKVSFYYTVDMGYLSNGSMDNLSDPYIDSFRIWQKGIGYSINEGLLDTFYIDDVTVEEVGAEIDTSVSGEDVSINVRYAQNVKEEYARCGIFEYENSRLVGAYVGDKEKTKEGPITAKSSHSYKRHSLSSKVYSVVFGNDYNNAISNMSEIVDLPSEYEMVEKDVAIKRAKDMLVMSTATYKDALHEGLMKEDAYFFTTDDAFYDKEKLSDMAGKADLLTVSSKSDALLNFDISSCDYKSTSHAYISLYAKNVRSPGMTQMYEVTNDWRENDGSYNSYTKGEMISSLEISHPVIVYMYDVSSLVNKYLMEGKKTLSVAIVTDNGDISFASKETSEKSFRPSLILEGLGMKQGEKKVSSYDYSNYSDVMKRKKTPSDVFVPTPTRTLDSIKDYNKVTESPKVNKYGSFLDEGRYNATGFFRTELIDGRWWIIDPEGYKYIYNGIAYVVYNHSTKTDKFQAKYGDIKGWASAIPDELRSYGFNGCGTTSQYQILLNDITPDTTPLPQLVREFSFVHGYSTDSLETKMLDVFDPDFETHADSLAKRYIAPYKDNPYILGWCTDNEPIAGDDMLIAYLTCDPEVKGNEYSYYTAWEWLKSRHGENATTSDITDEDRNDWVEFVYDRYMRVCFDAIRKYDTNHMIMGPKLDKPHQGSFRGLQKYVDVVLYDYYGNAWTADMPQVDQWYRWAGKPLINAEWYVKGMDACTPYSELTNQAGVGWTVETQKERGAYYQSFVLSMLESKVFVGWHWYRYMDNDPRYKNNHSSNIDSNKGIVDRDYEYQEEFLSYMKTMNDNVPTIIKYFDK
ncbi:MAG: DNRLRE domain-containing protein [Ruminococcaceae bacterium]|nr:DNRLRE domain-containing protein [Oscillospiraceae bacterium]